MVLLGNGDGTFQTALSVSGAALGTGTGNKLIAADLNRDGKTDLAYIASNGNLMTLLSAGDGTFRAVSAPPPNAKPALTAVADLNGDGVPDLIFFNGNNDSLVSYAYGRGDGTFDAPIIVPLPPNLTSPNLGNASPNPHPLAVLTADFNRDGRPDLTVSASRINQGTGSGSTPYSLVEVFTLFSQPGGLGAPVNESIFGNTHMLAGNFFAGASPDVAYWGSDGAYDVLNLDIEPSFSRNQQLTPNLIATDISSFDAVGAGDLDGDGKDELVIGSGLFNGLVIYRSQGVGMVRAGFVDLGSSPKDIVVVDLNGDGKPDIVSANSSPNATVAINTTPFPGKLSSVVNGATFGAGQPVAPGSLVSAFGTSLATTPALAGSIPLPLVLGGVSVTVGGVPAPVLFVNSTQVNFQVPWTVPPGSADVVVTANGTALPKLNITIAAVAPGIWSTQSGSGQAIAINTDGSLAGPAESIPGLALRPAAPGDTIVVLATGLGAVSPAVATGANSTDALRLTTATPVVLIGGKPATVTFSGLSPQFVGVNQLNIVVPPLSAGVVSLQIEGGGIRTSDKVTIAIGNP